MTAYLVGLEACPPHRPGEDTRPLLFVAHPTLGTGLGPPAPGCWCLPAVFLGDTVR